jgi:hypothetical protein
MRASFDVSLGSTKSLGGFDVLAGSGLAVAVVGSGVDSLAAAFAGFERVRAIAISMLIQLKCCKCERLVQRKSYELFLDDRQVANASAELARDPCHFVCFGLDYPSREPLSIVNKRPGTQTYPDRAH